MEPDGVHVGVFGAAGYLVAGEPALVAALKLHLVAVAGGLRRTEDGAQRREGYLADAGELVVDLALLHLQLLGVGENLPLTSPTDSEMAAHWRHTQRTGPHQARSLAFAIVLPLLANLDVDHVAGHHEGHEDHFLVDVGNAFAFGSARLYLYAFV